MPNDNGSWTLWTFTGISGIFLPSAGEFPLTEGLSVLPVSPFILSRWSSQDLNLRQKREMEEVGHYVVYKCSTQWRDPIREAWARHQLLNALMGIQIVKPNPTLGYVLQQIETSEGGGPIPGPIELRAPMDPGQWPTLRQLDHEFLEQAVGMIVRVNDVMNGREPRKKNAIHLFELALEHHHPAIACLLAVASMEASLDTWTARGFEEGLCNLLGKDAVAFPDWNSPDFAQPRYTVGELAYNLHRLRSTVVHGGDLRSAEGKSGQIIDFRRLSDFIAEQHKPTFMQLLCEASFCLASQVLQKSL